MITCEIDLKVIPNASRDQIVGWYGNALKVKTATPPEGGKANKAICALLAKELNLAKNAVSVVKGATSPLKTVRLEGISEAELRERIH